MSLVGVGQVHAEDLTYTQNFQNDTTTLSGKSTATSMYFTKMDYWNVKKATFNFNYQVSQLADKTTSDITLSMNGVKFYSFRPEHKSGFQSKAVEIPLELLQGTNKLEIKGQILNKKDAKNYDLAQTPANWLTIKSGTNMNFKYEVKDPENTLRSFYDHFSGEDTIANQHSKIVTPDQPIKAELAAGMTALTGISHATTTNNNQISVVQNTNMDATKGDYILYVAKYDNLPKALKQEISEKDVEKRAVIKTHYTKKGDYLIVTAKTDGLLKKASQFFANPELMQQTNKSTEMISYLTNTFMSKVQDRGKYQLTNVIDKIKDAGHHETNYLVTLPNDRTNADGSEVKLHFRYSKNLNFKRSLVTVYVNDTTLGSKKLTAAKANGDEVTLEVPKGTSLGNSFEVRVAFDLEMKDQEISDNSETPWAEVDTNSEMKVKSEKSNDLLFTNYPTIFMKNQTYNNLAVVIPKKLTAIDFKSLTNIFNLMGAYAKSNTGKIKFYTEQPNQDTMINDNLIVLGTPSNNAMIKSLNKDLYFKYSDDYRGFVSNEKLSIEEDYGKTIGTAQLIRSTENSKKGILVLTGATPEASYLASTQLNFKKNIDQFTGDAIVVDQNNNHYSYRFKKNKYIDRNLEHKRTISNNSQLIIYLGIVFLALIVIGFGVYLVFRKQAMMNGGRKNAKQK
ncbi:cellulose biosynthesis cyclic di-GMP-binding regulatory protein BcsB [Pediococcus pentosaceus]|uniref:cellulose biosynthesis cyclic di-GMP-binding regulatory protein BcsB n=1 Tax=Pediococcus pentosaceus TaxID=1255 RepID=UPI003F82DC8A